MRKSTRKRTASEFEAMRSDRLVLRMSQFAEVHLDQATLDRRRVREACLQMQQAFTQAFAVRLERRFAALLSRDSDAAPRRRMVRNQRQPVLALPTSVVCSR